MWSAQSSPGPTRPDTPTLPDNVSVTFRRQISLVLDNISTIEQKRLLLTRNRELCAYFNSNRPDVIDYIFGNSNRKSKLSTPAPVSSATSVPELSSYVNASNDPNDSGKLIRVLDPSVSKSEKRLILEKDPQLYASLISKRPDLIADIFQDDPGKPLADSDSNIAVLNLPTPMDIGNSSVNQSTINVKPNSKFHFVDPPKRLQAKKGTELEPTPALRTSNKFDNLPEVSLSDPKTTNKDTPVTPVPKTPRIRPIQFIKNDKFPELVQHIASNVDNDFTYTTNAKFVKIFPKTVFAHTKIVEFMKTSNYAGFFSPIQDVSPLKVVIRGLDIDTDLNDIQNSLTDAGFKPLKTTQFTTRKSGITNMIPLFQIQLLDTPHNKNILSLTSLNYRRIKIEPYRNKRLVTQCFNCQNFNHHAVNCFLPPRCLRCAKEHKTHECPHIIEKLPQPLCCNCNLNHPANYRGCAKFPKPRPFPIQKPVSSKFSYAQAAKTTDSTNSLAPPIAPPTASPIGQFVDSPLLAISTVLKEIEQELNIKSLYTLLKTLKDLLKDIKDNSSPENRFFLLVQRLPNLFSFAP